MVERPLTRPEAIAVTVVTALAALIATGYFWARIADLSPFALLGFTIATTAVIGIALIRRSTVDRAALLAVVAVFVVALALLVRLAWPALLPSGAGADLTHHLQLIDYIERHWRLPDVSFEPVLGEMTHYTPGLHVVAALAGAWSGTSGLQAVYSVIAVAVALKLVLVFLIGLRVFAARAARIPLALAAVMFALAPRAYSLDSFARDSFLAQVFAELFAVAVWWAMVVWDERPSATAVMLAAASGVAAFLTWPVWIGPPLVALVATVIARSDLPWRRRMGHLAIAVSPVALAAALHALGRTGWIRMAATSGGVLRPTIEAFGWSLLVLAVAGLVLATRQRRARPTLLLVLALTVQAASLYVVAQSAGASTPYMAFKMFYLLVYPLAVLAVLPIALAIETFVRSRAAAPALAWSLVVILALTSARLTPPPRAPVVSNDLYVAGRWARANLEAACVEYLVPSADTAYWLHLAVMGNPRMTPRTGDNNTFDPARNVLRWMQTGGLPYAIVNEPTAPREVFDQADRLEQFGTASVLRRHGPVSCLDAQRFALRVLMTP